MTGLADYAYFALCEAFHKAEKRAGSQHDRTAGI